MIIKKDGYDLVIDKEIDFIMLQGCYRLGCNCLNCTERIFDGCIIDEIDINEIYEETKNESNENTKC